MIRHGFDHESLYRSIFPEREHRYPRPDNLQRYAYFSNCGEVLCFNCSTYRHVIVNHMDKDANDPQLREVLAQRIEGGSRGRRRQLGS